MNADDPDKTTQRPRRWWRWAIALVGFAGLSVLAGVLYVGYTVTRAYEAAVAEADRLDPGGWRMKDLEARRAVLPDEQNGALRVIAVQDSLPVDWKLHPGPSPPASPPPDGGPARLTGQALLDKVSANPPNVLLEKDVAEAVQSERTRLDKSIGLARSLVRFPNGRYPIDWKPNPLDIPLLPAELTYSAALILSLDAVAQSQAGNSDTALDSCLAMLNVARSIGDAPLEMSQLLRATVTSWTVGAVQRTLACGEPGDEALARLQNAVTAESAEPFCLLALRAERAKAFQIVDNLDKGAFSLNQPGVAGYGWRLISSGPQGHLLYRYNQALTLEFYTRAVEIARRPIQEQPRLWNEWNNDLAARHEPWLARLFGALTFTMMPLLDHRNLLAIQTGNRVGLCAVMLAAERYRQAKGSWPDSAGAIEKALAVKLPLDPFLNAPYHLKRIEDGLNVYSVGANFHDDGGALDNGIASPKPNTDFGYKLWDVARRRQQPPAPVAMTDTPDRVDPPPIRPIPETDDPIVPIPERYDPRNVSAEQFLELVKAVPWLERLGKPHEADAQVIRIHEWKEVPGPDSRGMGSLLNEQSAWQDDVFARWKGEKAAIEAYWKQIDHLVWERAKTRVDYQDGADVEYMPNLAVGTAGWIAASVGCYRLAGLKIPPNLLRQWSWYVHGHWPFSYEEDVEFPALDLKGIPRSKARLIVF